MPGDPSLTNPYDEIRNIEAYMLRRRTVQAQVAAFTPTSAALYANYARQYPWMPPGVIRSASMAGYSPDNPDMVRMARASLAEGMDTGRITNGQRQRATAQNPGYREPTIEGMPSLTRRPQSNGVTRDPYERYAALGFIDEEGQLHRPAEPEFKEWKDDKAVFEYKSDKDKQLDHQFTEFLRLIASTQSSNKPIPYQIGEEWRQWHPKTGNSEVLGARPEPTYGGIVNPTQMEIPLVSPAINAIQDVVNPAYQAAQPAIRVAGMVANYPVQEVQQIGRNIHAAVRDVQQNGWGHFLTAPASEIEGTHYGGETTDIGIAAEQLAQGESVDTGSGFFVSPTSQVARERRAREAEAGLIGGHVVTWGRWAASAVTEPNTIPFDVLSGFVDLSVQIADPSAFGMGEAGKARRAAALFEAEDVASVGRTVGLLGSRGRYPSVNINTAERIFDSGPGARAIDDLTSTTSAYQIGKKLSRGQMEFRHDPALYEALARTTTPAETRAVMDEAISGGQIREVADVTKSWGHGIAAHIRPRMPRSRLMDKMPGQGLHLSDPRDTANQIMRSFSNVNAPEEAMEEAFNVLASQTTRSGRLNAIFQVFGSGPNSLLAHHDINPEIADQMTRLFKDSIVDMHRGLVDELGTEVPTWEHTLINGEKTLVGGPHALIELIEDYVPLPDSRKLREMTKMYPNLLAKLGEEGVGGAVHQLIDLPPAFIDYAVQEIWKPLQLARGAWLVRVLGEGQMRIAADGLDSLFSGHPLEAIGYMMSKPHFGVKNRVPMSFLDDNWDEVLQYENSLSRVNNWTYRPGAQDTTTRTNLLQKGRHADKEYRHAWARQLLKFNYDEVYSKWLQTDSLDELTDWLVNGAGQKALREFQEAFPGNLQTPEQVRKYLDDIEQRFNMLTSGNTDLFDVLRSGEFTNSKGEIASIYRNGRRSGNPEVNPQFTEYLAAHMDDGPPIMVERGMQATRGKSDYPALRRHAVQNFLYGAMSWSENLIARSPVFKQAYTREMADMIQFGADEIRNAKGVITSRPRADMIAKARKLNVPNRTIKHMEHLASIKKPGRLSLEEMDMVAKGRAMDRAQKLLYSYGERRQVFDIARNLFPFGDAWYEVFSTWGRIIGNSAGKPLRRGQQIIEGSINSGFFHENRFGELAFTYPFSGAITEAVTGTPVPMEGRVKGLSMFGEVIPGLGPVAQIPAAWFLKDKPELKDVEDFLLPFGADEGIDIFNYKTYMPGWMKTAFSLVGFRTADEQRLWENTTSQIINYKFSTGEYGMSEAEQDRLVQDAKAEAKKVYFLRMIGQFWGPAAPSPEFYVNDKTGTRLSAMALSEEFHKNDQEDFETSVANFIDKYGEGALGALVASSATSVPGFPDSREGQQWIDDHPDIKGNYPLVYALFAPEGEWDPDVYVRQFQGPDRQALTAQQHTAMLGDWLNRYWRSEAMNRMGVNSYSDMNQTQRNVWEDISRVIDETYPNARVGIFEKPQVNDMIVQLERAAQDPDIQATPAGPALTQYLALRAEAQAGVDALKERGLISNSIKGFTKAKVLAPLREALRSNAQALIDENPAFEPLWDFVFSRELAED